MKNKNLAIAGICTLLLVLVLSATYAYYTINLSNSFTNPVNVGASTEEVGTVIISSSTNNIELNLTRSNLLSEIGTLWYGVTSGEPTSTESLIKLGELSTTSGAVLCDVTMTVTFTNKELVSALVSTGELELNIGDTVVDLYNKKSETSFNVLIEDFYTDTNGNDLEGNIIYHITNSDQNSEAGKSAGLTINYSSMTCSPTEEIKTIPKNLAIGDFVTYDAGTWTAEEIASIKVGPNSSLVSANNSLDLPTNSYQFGGFTVGSSRNSGAKEHCWDDDLLFCGYGKMYDNGISSNQVALSGWRIWDIDEKKEIVTIVSAADPEDYYHGSSANSAYISQYILTGTKDAEWSEAGTAKSTYTKRDWSMYENSLYGASNARMLTYYDLNNWYSKNLGTNVTPTMYENDAYGASNARMLNDTDLTNWYNKNLGRSGPPSMFDDDNRFRMIYTEPYLKYQNLIDNHTLYWLGVADGSTAMRLVYPTSRRVYGNYIVAFGAGLLASVPLEPLDGAFGAMLLGSSPEPLDGAFGARLLVSIPLESLVGSKDIGDRTVTLDGMKYIDDDDHEQYYGTETTQTYNVWELNEREIHYAFGDPTTSSPTTPPTDKNVYVGLYPGGKKAVCINRNGTQHCFKNNKWTVEKRHVQKVFSDISCYDNSFYYDDCDASDFGCIVDCGASDFYCSVYSNGFVACINHGTNEGCYVDSSGNVDCGGLDAFEGCEMDSDGVMDCS